MTTMNFPSNKFDIKTVAIKTFYNSIINLMYRSVIYHSHVTREINGYAHGFCNQKVRENKKFVPLFAHLFVLKGRRLCVWRTKQLNIV